MASWRARYRGEVMSDGPRFYYPLVENEPAYDSFAEQDKTPTERAYYEANRDIEPQMEEWRAE